MLAGFGLVQCTMRCLITTSNRTLTSPVFSPGRTGSRTHKYKRNGTTGLHAAFNILTGKVIGKVADRKRTKEFLAFMKHLQWRDGSHGWNAAQSTAAYSPV